ncbi:uncharacterized protein MCYG_00790 [Microsporum canis CBS 113480]|uniref:Uncharacterized protein n=1 Tax=Arthroderma otae (strain ATCC MYA-4605 / CBS 113480) TaxID=554155 RepID=C5FDC8_ARTOC|nr:uncharacterized protein MCYG_00790 [Microsporum canis CBS 113480]EEQ27902.1 predicted protein [Microsporum canis CBS 113480]
MEFVVGGFREVLFRGIGLRSDSLACIPTNQSIGGDVGQCLKMQRRQSGENDMFPKINHQLNKAIIIGRCHERGLEFLFSAQDITKPNSSSFQQSSLISLRKPPYHCHHLPC